MTNELRVLDIPSTTRYWFVRANSQSQYYEDFLYNNFIAIDSNGLSLTKLFEIPSTIRSSDAALRDKYKQLFEEHDLQIFNSLIEGKKLSDEEIKKEKTVELRRSSLRATRMFQFVEKMNINDFVIVPYKSSQKFLIGVVTSECFTSPISRIQLLNDDGYLAYDTCKFPIKRRVLWIKELPQKQFPDSLSWIKTAHQSLFNISEYANKLNPCIYPLYRYKENVYFRIGVNTSKKISSSAWLDYQLLLRKITGEKLEELYQKQKVQSPGDIILYVIQKYWWLLCLVMGGLFGEVEINQAPVKVKFQGVFRFFSKGERLKRKLAAEKIQIEAAQDKANVDKTDVEILKGIKDIDDGKAAKSISESAYYIAKSVEARQKNNQARINKGFSEQETEKKLPPLPKDVQNDAEKVVSLFKLSNENPGSSIQYENQEDSLSVPKEESDKNKEK